MSYCELKSVGADGIVAHNRTLRNSHGFCMRVWNSLVTEFLKPTESYWLSNQETVSELWKLASNPELPRCARVVLASTFDKVMVKREDFASLATSMRVFDRMFPTPPDYVNHLPEMAGAIDSLLKDEGVQALCWYPMSVAEDPWYIEAEDDGYRSYDITKDEGHWFLFDHYPELKPGTAGEGTNEQKP